MRLRSCGAVVVLGFGLAAVSTTAQPAYAGSAVQPAYAGSAAPSSSLAAPCDAQPRTVAEQSEQADAVFEGIVRETRVPEPNAKGRIVDPVTYVVDVQRIYKDAAVVTDTVRIESSYYASTCGLGDLAPESVYYFFARAKRSGFRTSTSAGSGPVSDARRAEIEEVLGAGESTQPENTPPELTLEKVEAAEPRQLGRAVAPGAALTLVGLLGLAVVGFSRRRR